MSIDFANNFQQVDEFAKDVVSKARHVFYADVADSIASELFCFIRVVPSSDNEFEEQAQTFSRIIHVKILYPPGEAKYNAIDHTIFYDQDMGSAKAARMVAHELFHIWKNNPTDPTRTCDPYTRAVDYGIQAEKNADLFSLSLLRHHSYKPTWLPPATASDFIEFLNNEAGWPDWLTEDEVRRFVYMLYASH